MRLSRLRLLRPRFTVLTLLVLIGLCAPFLAYVRSIRVANERKMAAYERMIAKGFRFNMLGRAPASSGAEEKSWIGDFWKSITKQPKLPPFDFLTIQGYAPPDNVKWSVTDKDMEGLQYLPEIERIDIHSSQVTDQGLAVLGKLPRLKTIQLFESNRVTGEFLKHLPKSSPVEHLFLFRLQNLDAGSLTALARFKQLKSLTITDAPKLTDDGLHGVSLPSSVTEFAVSNVNLGDETFTRWLGNLRLQRLEIEAPITRAIVPALEKQTSLLALSIRNAPLVDEDFQFLAQCSSLDHLSLIGLPVRGGFLKKLPNDTSLHFVNLSGSPMTDENASELKRLKNLVDLDLSWTPIVGKCFENASWPMIQRLNLQGTRLSEPGKANAARLGAPATVTYPSNFAALDLKRLTAGKPPADVTLNMLFAAEANANSIAVTSFYPPNFQPPQIDRCPAEPMAPVAALLESAKNEAVEWEKQQAKKQLESAL